MVLLIFRHQGTSLLECNIFIHPKPIQHFYNEKTGLSTGTNHYRTSKLNKISVYEYFQLYISNTSLHYAFNHTERHGYLIPGHVLFNSLKQRIMVKRQEQDVFFILNEPEVQYSWRNQKYNVFLNASSM